MNDTTWLIANSRYAAQLNSAELHRLVERARRSTRSASSPLLLVLAPLGAFLGTKLLDSQMFWGDPGVPAAIGAAAGGSLALLLARGIRRARLKELMDGA